MCSGLLVSVCVCVFEYDRVCVCVCVCMQHDMTHTGTHMKFFYEVFSWAQPTPSKGGASFQATLL